MKKKDFLEALRHPGQMGSLSIVEPCVCGHSKDRHPFRSKKCAQYGCPCPYFFSREKLGQRDDGSFRMPDSWKVPDGHCRVHLAMASLCASCGHMLSQHIGYNEIGGCDCPSFVVDVPV